MSERYTLYWSPDSASFVAAALLEEIGAPYELSLVDLKAGQQRSADYLRINPNGLVPTLRLPDGQVIYGSGAIVLYLADRHPEAGLAPTSGDPARALYDQWLFYLADTLYPAYKRTNRPTRFTTDPASAGAVVDQAFADLACSWEILEAALEPGPYLLGPRFSAADIYLTMFTTWRHDREPPLSSLPRLSRLAAAGGEPWW